MFSLAALTADGGLLLARGRFGGRALYYAHTRFGLIACSRLAPLIALDADREVDELRLADSILNRPPEGDAASTIYRGVKRLRPAEILVARHDRGAGAPATAASVERLEMTALRFSAIPERTDIRDVAQEVRRLLAQSTARAIVGAPRVAVLAGGGTDSSALLASVLAQTRGATRREVDTLSLDFGGPGDDRPYMRALARDLRIEPILVGARACAPHFRASFVIDGAPLLSPALAWCVALTKAARLRGASVVLTGFGGDELFEGDLGSFASRASRGDLRAVWDALRLKGGYMNGVWARAKGLLIRPLIRRALPSAARRALRRARESAVPWHGPRLRARAAMDSGDAEARGRSPRNLATASYLADIVDNDARVEVAGGCITSAPYLDEDLVQFVSGLPPQMLFAHHTHRGLLREVMRGAVPDAVRLRRDKWAASAAVTEIFRASGGLRSVERLLSMRALGERGLVEPTTFARSFREFAEAPGAGLRWAEFWPALAAEAFVSGVVNHEATAATEARA
jgi:asparagine synthase (glutamine-hydrolysing)